MTRPAMKYLAVLVVLGLGTFGLLFRALLANRENGRSHPAEMCPAPTWKPPLQSEIPKASPRLERPRTSLPTFSASQPKLATPTLQNEATNQAAPQLQEDKLAEELIAVQTEIARTQLQIGMLQSKGLTREVGERKSSLEDLKKRAATLREQVGPNPEAPAVVPAQPKP